MKERMKQMSQCCDEATREDGDVCTTEAIKYDGELDCEEAVRVENIGKCWDLHVKCPRGKGFWLLKAARATARKPRGIYEIQERELFGVAVQRKEHELRRWLSVDDIEKECRRFERAFIEEEVSVGNVEIESCYKR
ncbi:hypothetical protein QQP08_017864 [Theobroma cacao]|nr:hypothetical protein QQP08_017864 [Theobroma cacao]